MLLNTVALSALVASCAFASLNATEETFTVTVFDCTTTPLNGFSTAPYTGTAKNGTSNYSAPAVSVGQGKGATLGTSLVGAAALAAAVVFGL